MAQLSRNSLLLQVATAAAQSHVKQTLLVQLVHPAPYAVTQEVHTPVLDVVQPDRYWLLLHVSASPPLAQSRAEQAVLVHVVQPAPCVSAQGVHAPPFVAVQPRRYWSAPQVSAPVLEQSRVMQLALVQRVHPEPCPPRVAFAAHSLQVPDEDVEQPSRY
jgi:hypothetical protein